MQLNNKISEEKLEINYKFYYFLKKLNSTEKLTTSQNQKILSTYFTNQNNNFLTIKSILHNLSSIFKSPKHLDTFEILIYKLTNKVDLEMLIFAIQLVEIKPLLLAEAKLVEISSLSKLSRYNQLSLEYDELSKSRPYFTRVNGALLSLLFFNKIDQKDSSFMSDITVDYMDSMFKKSEYLTAQGVEANQIFMLMFNESLNQSIVSDAGSSYEDRIMNVLISMGIKAESISKIHDKKDLSSEYDFYFNFEGSTFGLGAKRTLRERYKQFIKTTFSSDIDAMIEITLGTDLTIEKAKSIRTHGTYLIVADEVYNSQKYLQEIGGIYPASSFNLDLLRKIANLGKK